MQNKPKIKKVCSFCVSDLHLVTMLLPYLNSKMKEEKFITISERDLLEQEKLVLSRLTLNDENKKELTNIDWDTKDMSDYETMKINLNKICFNTQSLSIIVNGSKEYIERVNKNLSEYLAENSLNIGNIKIIDCYDITKLDEDIKDILKTHDAILNTSGEKEICEVFEGYEKRRYA